MDQEEILTFITQVETEDIDPVYAAKIYAATVDEMQSRMSAQDIKKLLLIGAAMFRSGNRGKYAELQLPASNNEVDASSMAEDEQFKGTLH